MCKRNNLAEKKIRDKYLPYFLNIPSTLKKGNVANAYLPKL
jgi:hypothetical protein